MKKILIFLFCLLWSTASYAVDNIYVAQSAAGNDDGSNCANAHSMVWLNTAGNWGNDAGDVTAGDTVHLCGTLTSELAIQGSGSDGSPITIYFEENAKFSKTTWTNTWIIDGTAYDYITIDGGTNGIIEATENGTDYDNKNQIGGITFGDGAEHITIKNLTIQNLYVRTSEDDDADAAGKGYGVGFGHVNYIYVHDCDLNDMYVAINAPVTSGSHYFYFYNNTIDRVNQGMVIKNDHGGDQAHDWYIYGNTFGDMSNWDDPPGHLVGHHESIVIWDYMTDVYIYNNKFNGPQGVSATAYIYANGTIGNVYIFNNVIVQPNAIGGFYTVRLGYAGMVFDNLIFCNNVVSDSIQGQILLSLTDIASVTVKNNIFHGSNSSSVEHSGITTLASDYNAWVSGVSAWASDKENSFSTNTTMVDSNWYPITGTSPTLIDEGVDLSSLGITELNSDKDGTTRGESWDIGAYEYGAGSSGVESPRGLTIQGGNKAATIGAGNKSMRIQ